MAATANERLGAHLQALGARSAAATAVDVISTRLSDHPRTVTTRIADRGGNQQFRLAHSLREKADSEKDPWTFWVEGAYRDFEGRPELNDAYGAKTFAVHIGLDWRKAHKGVLGVAFGRSQTDVNFNRLAPVPDPADTARMINPTRQVEVSLNAFYPYVQGRFSDRLTAWGVAGIGDGRMKVSHNTSALASFDSQINYKMAAAGARYLLNGSAQVLSFALKGDVFVAELSTSNLALQAADDLQAALAGSQGRSDRFRVGVETSYNCRISERGLWLSSVDLIAKLDRGGAESGFGVEVVADTQFRDLPSGFAMTGRINVLLHHDDDHYNATGLNFGVSLDPNATGYGLSLALNQGYGQGAGAGQGAGGGGGGGIDDGVGAIAGALKHSGRLLHQLHPYAEAALRHRWRTTLQVAYGLSAGAFIATPFVEMDLHDSRSHTQFGARFSKAHHQGGQLHMALYGQSKYLTLTDRIEKGIFLALSWTP